MDEMDMDMEDVVLDDDDAADLTILDQEGY
jgi:hypothetical protein